MSGPARFVFVAVMIGWLCFPVVMWGQLTLDAVPLIAAGRVAATDPAQLYVASAQDPEALTPRFNEESCAAMPPGTDCAQYSFPFTHTPMVLPVVLLLGKLPNDVAAFLCRLMSAGGLVGGMALLWQLVTRRAPGAAPLFAAGAALLTPFAVITIGIGQSSSILFLSVCVGISRSRTTRGALASSAVWTATVVMKAWPAALVLVALLQRRWKLLAFSVLWTAVLLAGALAIGGTRSLGDFVESSRALRTVSFANGYNRGIDALAYTIAPSWNGDSAAYLLSVLVRIGVVVALWRVRIRRTAADVQWAFAWVAVLWFIPLVWFHYWWVIVGAAFLMVVDRLDEDPRWAWLFPVVGVLSALGALGNDQSPAMSASLGVALVAILVGLAFLAVPTDPAARTRPVAAGARPDPTGS